MSSNEQSNSNDQSNSGSENTAGGFDVEKILFILFSHKWKILISGVLGLIAAACVFFFLQKPVYQSRAKLLVRYVVEALAVDQINVQSVSGRYMIPPLNNEMAIITSLDLSQEVAESISMDPQKLVPNTKESVTEADIASVIRGGLEATLVRNSNIINISFTHPDPEVPTKILDLLVSMYFEKHIRTYRSDLASGVLEKEIFETKETLRIAEETITDLMAGIVSISDEQQALSQRKQKLDEQIALVEADLSAQRRRVELLQDLPESQDVTPDETILDQKTHTIDEAEKFNDLVSRLSSLYEQKMNSILIHKQDSNTIKIIQNQIDSTEKEKAKLLAQFPSLAIIEKSSENIRDIPVNSLDLKLEKSRLAEMEARIDILKEEKTQLDSEIKRIAQIIVNIAPHQRKKEISEMRLESLEAAKSRADGDILISDSAKQGGLPNIALVQRPSAAFPVASDLVKQVSLGLAGAGFVFGIGMALIIEIFIDRTVKRPKEFEARLHIPLMISIPYIKNASIGQVPANKIKSDDKIVKSVEKKKNKNQILSSLEPWDPNHFIRPFTDTMRDRLVSYLQIDETLNSPELIALTGFLNGSGTTSIAEGLAASLLDIDKKTLYVNLNVDNSAIAENAKFEIEQKNDTPWSLGEYLTLKKRHEKLFMADLNFTNANEQNRCLTPKKLYHLITKLRSVDFEYIIFDMPLYGPTSPTLTMTNFMDKVIVVVAAGKTSRDDIRYYHKQLVAGNADVFTVFNNTDEKLSSWPKS